jgi:undecaprenyl-diphosphatase
MAPFSTPFDAQLFFDVYAARQGSLAEAARMLSAIGSGWSMLGLLPLYAVASWRRLALWLTGTLLASATLVFLLKALVGRPRPCVALPGVQALCAMPTDPSFPSGHACGSFTVAAFFVVAMYAVPAQRRALRALIAVSLVLLASAIAWSRVYLGVHFPGDVVAGALLGAMVGGVAALRMSRLSIPSSGAA